MSGQRGPVQGHGAMVTKAYFGVLKISLEPQMHLNPIKKSESFVFSHLVKPGVLNPPLTMLSFVQQKILIKGSFDKHTDEASIGQNVVLIFQERAI